MKKINFEDRYKKYPKEIQEYMSYVKDSLIDKYGEIFPHYLVSLDTLAMNLNIIRMAALDIEENGFHHKDYKGIDRKSGSVQTFNNAQISALKIMNNFGLSPMAEARIKTNKKERALSEYVSNLTGGFDEEDEDGDEL